MSDMDLILEKLNNMDKKIDRNYVQNKDEHKRMLAQLLVTNGKVKVHRLIFWIVGSFSAGLGLINIKTIIAFLI